MTTHPRLELVCPAGTPAALRTAINAGADIVYCGYRDETNARNFPGLNFSRTEMEEAIAYSHERETKVFVAINTFPRAGQEHLWHRAIDDSAAMHADALILADLGLLTYAAKRYPHLRRHLSVRAAAANAAAINFYTREFGIRRVALPRILSVEEITAINHEIYCETEAFIHGSPCVVVEDRCSQTSCVTGASSNLGGVCPPGSHVSYRRDDDKMVSPLSDFTIHRVGKTAPAPYPTVCKGSFGTVNFQDYTFKSSVGLDASILIPQLTEAGVTALRIEECQRDRSHMSTVVKTLRRTIDNYAAGLRLARAPWPI
jgi:putative protease